jgi:hypothetical protein
MANVLVTVVTDVTLVTLLGRVSKSGSALVDSLGRSDRVSGAGAARVAFPGEAIDTEARRALVDPDEGFVAFGDFGIVFFAFVHLDGEVDQALGLHAELVQGGGELVEGIRLHGFPAPGGAWRPAAARLGSAGGLVGCPGGRGIAGAAARGRALGAVGAPIAIRAAAGRWTPSTLGAPATAGRSSAGSPSTTAAKAATWGAAPRSTLIGHASLPFAVCGGWRVSRRRPRPAPRDYTTCAGPVRGRRSSSGSHGD